MGDDGVSDVSAGAGEGVGRMVNGTSHTSGSIARLGACGGGSSVGAEIRVDNELVEVGGFSRPHPHQFETAYQLFLKSRHTPDLNIH